jgi:hypothetical protein
MKVFYILLLISSKDLLTIYFYLNTMKDNFLEKTFSFERYLSKLKNGMKEYESKGRNYQRKSFNGKLISEAISQNGEIWDLIKLDKYKKVLGKFSGESLEAYKVLQIETSYQKRVLLMQRPLILN